MLGGRVAEEIVFSDVTTGAENDLVEVTRLARRMVTRWGMGSLGPVAFKADEEQPFLGYELSQGRDYGQETADHIDRDVQELLAERREFVRHLLTEQRVKLDALANALLQDETVDTDSIVIVLGPRPVDEVAVGVT
jgi:cell division protease FtsH